MDYCVKNDNDVPVLLESIGLRVPAKSKSRVLTEAEYLALCRSGESPEGVSLIPVLLEKESKKPKLQVTAKKSTKKKKE